MDRFDYPVRLEADERGIVTVTFPDVPGAITEGDGEVEALAHAVDALETMLAAHIKDGDAIPRPRRSKKGGRILRPSPLARMKVAVYEAMREQQVTKAELGRRLGWHALQMDRLPDLGHASKVEHLATALEALGLSVRVEIEKAA